MANSHTFASGENLTAALINSHLVNQVPVAGDAYDTGWLQTGVTWGTTYESYSPTVASNVFEYRRVGMRVELRGLIRRITSNYTSTAASTMVTMPVGFRPSRNLFVASVTNAELVSGAASAGTAHTHTIGTSANTGPVVRISVNSAGTIQVSIGGGTTLAVDNWVSVSGISYFVD